MCGGNQATFMVLRLDLQKLSARSALALIVLAGCAVLVVIIGSRFVIGALADDRLSVTREMLAIPVAYFPNSARLNWRLASAELAESDRDLASARTHAQRAVN